MPLPTHIVEEIVTLARGDRGVVPNEVPSPRGVADFRQSGFDKTIRLFKSREFRDSLIVELGHQFLKDVLEKILTLMENRRSLRAIPDDVTRALEFLVPNISETMQGIVEERGAGRMDVDETSDYDGSDGEFEFDHDDASVMDDVPGFDDTYPPVDDIATSDAQFKDEVMLPFVRAEFHMLNPDLLLGKRFMAGMVKQAFFAFLVAELSQRYQILDQLEEASSLLELALWKAKIDQSAGAGEKAQCRMTCGAGTVIPNVLPYLFRGMSEGAVAVQMVKWRLT